MMRSKFVTVKYFIEPKRSLDTMITELSRLKARATKEYGENAIAFIKSISEDKNNPDTYLIEFYISSPIYINEEEINHE